MQIKPLTILFLLPLLFNSCVEEYWPEIDKYDNILVVDGIIHNEAGPYTIKLSRSSRVDKPVYNGVAQATVKIFDDTGSEILLTEQERGTYLTPENFRAYAGNSYYLYIKTVQGEEYESTLSTLPESIGIDTVFHQIEYQNDPQYYYEKPGVQFYVSTHEAASDSTYILWQLTETFEYHADHLIYYVFEGFLREMLHRDSLRVCYRTLDIPQIFTQNTLTLQNPVLQNIPLNFVDTETKRLQARYSLLVKQYHINSSDYNYWNNLKNINNSQGSLYSTQPYPVKGNIHNINNPEEPVLGNFTVAGVDHKRVFVTRPSGISFYYGVCDINELMRFSIFTAILQPAGRYI